MGDTKTRMAGALGLAEELATKEDGYIKVSGEKLTQVATISWVCARQGVKFSSLSQEWRTQRRNHGDIGCRDEGDIVVILSYFSGEDDTEVPLVECGDDVNLTRSGMPK